MAQTSQNLNGNGDVDYVFTFPSIKIEDIKVEVNGSTKTVDTDYTISDYSTQSGGKVNFVTSIGSPLTSTDTVRIFRDTDIEQVRLAYQAGSSIKADQLNDNNKQLLYFIQEVENRNEQMTFIGSDPPSDPRLGAIWFQPELGRLFVYYLDPDGDSYWIECNPAFTSGDLSNISVTNLTDANIAENADIQGSKLLNDSIPLTKFSSGSLPLDITVQSANIVNGTIVDDDIKSDAAIAQSKLNLSIGVNELASNAVTNVKVAGNAAIDASKIVFDPPHSKPAGTVARDLETILAHDIINVKDFGAKGDNSQDDQPAIQAAIDACGSNGGKVVFPPGKYRLDSTINIGTADHAIILEGLAGMTVNDDNFMVRLFRIDGASGPYIKCTSARSLEIRNIAFIGGTFGTTNASTAGSGVRPTSTAPISDGTEAALHIVAAPGTQEHIYDNLQFHGISQCMNLDGLSSSIIRNCKFRNIPEGAVGDAVIKLLGSSSTDRMDQIRILDCIIDGSPASGIGPFGDRSLTSETTPSGPQDHWRASYAGYSIGEKVKNDGDRAYELTSTGTTAASTGPTGEGTTISDGVDATWKFLGNTINRTVRGIYFDGEVNTIFIQNTSVIRCRDSYFLNSSWKGEFVYFQNAEAERALVDGFSLNGEKGFIKLDNPYSSTCFDNGIHINDGLKTSVSIVNCNVRDNQSNGIRIDAHQNIANISIINPIIGGNSKSGLNNASGIFIEDNIDNVSIIGGRIGGGTADLLGVAPQKYGIDVSGANHEHIRIIGVDVVGNTTGSIHWKTTGSSTNVNANSYNFIQDCPGYNPGQTTFAITNN